MFLISYFWGWILLLIFTFSPGARAAVGRLTRDVGDAAQAIVIFMWENIGRRLLGWTAIIFAAAIVLGAAGAIIDIWWAPAKLAAPLLLLVWFFLVRAAVNATIGALQAASKGALEPLVKGVTGMLAEEGEEAGGAGIDVEPTRQALVEALQAGIRPLTWLVVCAALWGIQIIVFPEVNGTTGLFIIFIIVALNLIGSLLGKVSRLPERVAQFSVIVAIIVFCIELPLRNTLPGAAALELMEQANRKSTAAIRKIAGGTWKGAVAEEHRDGLEREFNRPFRVSLYKDFWKEDPRIFNKDTSEVRRGTVQYRLTIADLESRPFVVIKEAEIPRVVTQMVGNSIDFVLIQASPGEALDQYFVPSRCIEWGSESRLQAAKQGLHSAAETRASEVEEKKLEQFPKTRLWQVRTDSAWFWRFNPVDKSVGPLEHPMVGSRWEIREEMEHNNLPETIKNFEGSVDMLFLKVSDVKNPAVLYIIRDQWGGGEVPNPFRF